MRNPSYLLLSRHNIYYFRWPLPRQIQATGKTIHVKLSLDTRDPKEAIRLSTMLQDHGYNLLKQDWVLGMDYAQIKGMVIAHNDCRVNDRFLNKTKDVNNPLNVSDSGKIIITDLWLRKTSYALDGAVFRFDEIVAKKFVLETKTKVEGSKREWS